MRHARPEDLDLLEPLLARLRAFPALKEKSRGVFYVKGRAYLHFHADPAGFFADVRSPEGSGFIRLKLDDNAGSDELVEYVRVQTGPAT